MRPSVSLTIQREEMVPRVMAELGPREKNGPVGFNFREHDSTL